MRFIPAPLEGAYLIELDKREDDRGFFARLFCEREFGDAGLETRFVQINNSLSKEPYTLRGLHYQLGESAEVKVMRCIRGALWDAIVDMRPGSQTFGHSFGAELSADNRKMLYCPRGFAHGFMSLTPDTESFYFASAFYAPNLERGVRWNDPRFSINWPVPPQIVSEKDGNMRDFDPAWHLENTPSSTW